LHGHPPIDLGAVSLVVTVARAGLTEANDLEQQARGRSLVSRLVVGDDEPTMSHDRPPDYQPDQEATSLTIGQAARVLGVSENAVRQRIKRRSLPAAKVEGVWRVWLPDQEERPGGDHQPDHPRDHEGDYQDDQEATTASVSVSPAARAQLEAVRDEWLQPLVDQLRSAERTIGRLEAERDALAVEVERLKAAQDATVAAPEPQHEAQFVETAPDTSPSWWAPWWRRLFGLDR
ncbi:MAG: helix-turn-helix domain-containing protein, partial [Chloroflexota bacterium]|nr:helix-turn-helix domain-containing protein [Chloroflexota bacterium]